jgi:molybdate transport system ATP-binding protein
MSALHVQVSHRRGDFRLALDHRLPDKGVTALLGPSGSGKSTVLRMIAGLERPLEGSIRCGDELWFDAGRRIHLPPQRRRVGFVFQDYALFAHLTVAENVGYGLPRASRAPQVKRWLERLHLTPYAQRYPHQLSGGQRQRVALARALAPEPDVLLLDEPFSAVDANLRHHLREELLDTVSVLQRPVVLVTHDLDDARYLADRVGVIVDGALLRCGKTLDVFADPGSRAVALVLGWRNFLPVRSIAGRRVAGGWGELDLEQEPSVDTAWLGIRPEHVQMGREGLSARIERITELGAVRGVTCRLQDGTAVHLQRPWDAPLPAPGEGVRLRLPPAQLRALPESGTMRASGGDSAPAVEPCRGGSPVALTAEGEG